MILVSSFVLGRIYYSFLVPSKGAKLISSLLGIQLGILEINTLVYAIQVLTLGYCFNKLQIFSDFAGPEASFRGNRQSIQHTNVDKQRHLQL